MEGTTTPVSLPESPQSIQSYNRPEPLITERPYEEPPAPKNPVLRGLSLTLSAAVVSSIPFVSAYLWQNAGFKILRDLPELEDFPPCSDPTVIPRLADPSPHQMPVSPSRLESRASADVASRRFTSIPNFHAAYKAGTLNPLQVIESLLPLIRRDVREPTAHATAFVQVRADLVLEAAEASTVRWKVGKPLGLLDGVPIAVKDELDIEGYERKLGSKLAFKTRGISWCVKKLLEAGAIVVGKTTMHELGTDTTNNNPNDGTPLNPYNKTYYCGGSSGGSAYAISAGLVPLAIGADAGGSIRIPSSFCGIFGLKPTHDRVSRLPSPNGAASNGVTGPMAANMIDLELGFRLMATPDPSDPHSSLFPPPFSAHSESRPKILGIYKPWFDRADAKVRDRCTAAVAYLHEQLGYEVIDVAIPHLHPGQIAHALTALSELSVSHASSSVAGLTAPSQLLICVGRQTPAVDYLLAQRLRGLLMRHLAALFQRHPGLIVVTPTTAIPGWPIRGGDAELRTGLADANTSLRNAEYAWLANFTGCPSLQAPVGYVQAESGGGDIPVGIMGMGEWGVDEDLIGFGYDLERYISEGLHGGGKMPEAWVDVFKLAKADTK